MLLCFYLSIIKINLQQKNLLYFVNFISQFHCFPVNKKNAVL